MIKRKLLGASVASVALVAAGFAIAQAVIPTLSAINSTDLVQVVPNAMPGPGNKYAAAGLVSGSPTYVNGGAVLTAFTYTFLNGEVNYFVQPAGTLATGTLTTEPNPGDGKVECFTSTQTQTALTWTANTNQTINAGVHAAATLGVPNCIQYSAATGTWYQSAP